MVELSDGTLWEKYGSQEAVRALLERTGFMIESWFDQLAYHDDEPLVGIGAGQNGSGELACDFTESIPLVVNPAHPDPGLPGR